MRLEEPENEIRTHDFNPIVLTMALIVAPILWGGQPRSDLIKAGFIDRVGGRAFPQLERSWVLG